MLGPFNSDTWVPVLRRALLVLLLLALLVLCVLIVRPFLTPLLWAAILCYSAWPLFRGLRRTLRGLQTLAALLATLIVACVVILPVLWLLALVQGELIQAYQAISHYLAAGPHTLPAWVRGIPWVGDRLQETLNRYTANPSELAQQLSTYVLRGASALGAIIGGVGRNLVKLGLTLLIMFFFFRDGETIVAQMRRVASAVFGDRLDAYVLTAGRMTRAVVYGLIVTAFVQGVIAGLGYWIVGLTAPVLLGTLTGVLSIVPLVGTAIVWVPTGIWLMTSGHLIRGILLLIWGAVLVHPADNVLRPILISSATRVPFLVVMLGALGGLEAFGLLGLFIGPVLLGVAMALWREWAAAADDAKLV